MAHDASRPPASRLRSPATLLWPCLLPLGVLFGGGLLAGCDKSAAPGDPPRLEELTQALEAQNWPVDGITATNSIQVRDGSEFTGDIGVTQASTGSVLASGAEFAMGFNTKLTGSVRADTIRLEAGAIVTGTATYNAKSGAGTVQGGTNSSMVLPLPVSIPALATVSSGTLAITVGHSQTTALSAGNYAAVDVQSGNGGVPTLLRLSGGVYHVTQLTLGNDARIECLAECEVRVQGRVTIQDRAFVGPVAGVGIGPGNVQLLTTGGNGGSEPWSEPLSVSIGNDSELASYILAPNGTVGLGDRVDFLGKIVARDVLIGHNGDSQGVQLPVIVQQPAAQTVSPGDSAAFTVQASGEALVYQWKRDGNPVAGAITDTLTLSNVAAADDGAVFSVAISNTAGVTVSAGALLTVEACATIDATCDGLDDDCDGTADDDYAPTCDGNDRVVCVNGNEENAPCDDANACNGEETCDGAGVCQAGTAPTIDDGNACTADSCDPTTGVIHEPVAAGTACADGNLCNGDESCDGAGACQAGTAPTIDDGNACTADSCDPSTGVLHEAVAAGTACTDGNLCNGSETCDGAGVCQPGTPPSVDDGNLCTADSCDPAAGVLHVPFPAGTACADGNLCNGSETCDGAGACQAGTALTVDDGNACTADSCDPTTGVLHEAVAAGTACADGDLCNGDETCDGAGVCQAGTVPTIDDGNACTADSCDPTTGVLHEAVAAGTACADGKLCNVYALYRTRTCSSWRGAPWRKRVRNLARYLLALRSRCTA